MTDIYCLLFEDYETLDLMGPVEFLHRLPQVKLHYVSQHGGQISSRQGFCVATEKMGGIGAGGILVVPGGQGTRRLVADAAFIHALGGWADAADICLSICTGSALLAATGRLDGLAATSNKKAFEWVRGVNGKVDWQRVARWVKSGKFYTSSGVSAGMDMTLGFIADYAGMSAAEQIARDTEYRWNADCSADEFSGLYRV
ncbi:MAG: DJ-1/PfpI family protein [Neisseria sp.]|nr:DJ-1/PfpI family protein [Neisseria sp.]